MINASGVEKKENLIGRATALAGLAEYQAGAVVSRMALSKKTGTVTVFAFDKGELKHTFRAIRRNGLDPGRRRLHHHIRQGAVREGGRHAHYARPRASCAQGDPTIQDGPSDDQELNAMNLLIQAGAAAGIVGECALGLGLALTRWNHRHGSYSCKALPGERTGCSCSFPEP